MYVGRAGHMPQGSPAFDIYSSSNLPPQMMVSENLVVDCAHRILLFQGIDSAIFLGLAAGLLVLTYWWIRERIS